VRTARRSSPSALFGFPQFLRVKRLTDRRVLGNQCSSSRKRFSKLLRLSLNASAIQVSQS
jgi:hypothetical protein